MSHCSTQCSTHLAGSAPHGGIEMEDSHAFLHFGIFNRSLRCLRDSRPVGRSQNPAHGRRPSGRSPRCGAGLPPTAPPTPTPTPTDRPTTGPRSPPSSMVPHTATRLTCVPQFSQGEGDPPIVRRFPVEGRPPSAGSERPNRRTTPNLVGSRA